MSGKDKTFGDVLKENRVLVYGRFNELLADNERNVIAYERISEDDSIIVVLNNSFNDVENIEFQTNYRDEKYLDLISGNMIKTATNGKVVVSLEAKKGMILKRWNK